MRTVFFVIPLLLLLQPCPATAMEPAACEPFGVPFTPSAFPDLNRPVRVSVDGGWLELFSLGRRVGQVRLGFTPRRATVHGSTVLIVGPELGLTLVDLADLAAPRIAARLAADLPVDGYRVEDGRLYPTLGGRPLCADSVRQSDLQARSEAMARIRPHGIVEIGLGLGVGGYLHSGFIGAGIQLRLLRQFGPGHYLGLMFEGTAAAGGEEGWLLSASAFGYRYLGRHFFADVAPVLARAEGCVSKPISLGDCEGTDKDWVPMLKLRGGWMIRWGRGLVGLAAEVQAGQAFFMGVNLSFGFGWGDGGAR